VGSEERERSERGGHRLTLDMSEEGTHEVMIIYDDGGRSRSEEMKSSPTRWRWNFVTF